MRFIRKKKFTVKTTYLTEDKEIVIHIQKYFYIKLFKINLQLI